MQIHTVIHVGWLQKPEHKPLASSYRQRSRASLDKKLSLEANTNDTDRTDFPIRANPRHPRNPCSTSASLFVDALGIRNVNYLQIAQTTNLRSSAFICGSFFAEALDINKIEYIYLSLRALRSLRWCSC